MPIYDLRCEHCGVTIIDRYVKKAADVPNQVCICGRKGMKKKPSRSSFRLHNLKTGGFTNTSSKSESNG